MNGKWLSLLFIPSLLRSQPLDDHFDLSRLKGAKLGYYIGSFDPLHLGHEQVVEEALASGHVDYILIYPVPGGDSFKNRTDWPLRQKMVAAVYQNHPHVLTTSWTPKELQDRLPPDLEMIGIIGSDVVAESLLGPDPNLSAKYRAVFMRGLPLQEKHFSDTVGALMALKANSFLVALRGNFDPSPWQHHIDDRPIIAYLPSEPRSSTQIREAIQNEQPFSHLVSPPVQEIIEEEGLYDFHR